MQQKISTNYFRLIDGGIMDGVRVKSLPARLMARGGDFTLTPGYSWILTPGDSFPRDSAGLHLGLLVILQADLFNQSKLGFQPVHVFLLVVEDIFQEFAGDIIPLGFTVGYGFP